MSFKPMGRRLLVECYDMAKERTGGKRRIRHKVVARGTGKDARYETMLTPSASDTPLTIGAIVLVEEYGGTEIQIDGEAYLIVLESQILGVFEEEPKSAPEDLGQTVWEAQDELIKGVIAEAENGFEKGQTFTAKDDFASAAGVMIASLEKIGRWLRAGRVGKDNILGNIEE